MKLRIASVNLLHGRSLTDGLVDSERMATAVADLDADVVALQEVDSHQTRSGSTNQTALIAAEVARRTGSYVHWRFVPALIGTPGEQWQPAVNGEGVSGDHCSDQPTVVPAPGYGVAMISRLPVSGWSTVVLPASPVSAPVYVPGLRRWLMLRDEPRVAISASLAIDIDGDDVSLAVSGTHLSFVPGWNVRQLRQLATRLSPAQGCAASILLGDLNVPAPIPARSSRWESLTGRLLTFPGPGPKMQIDHAMIQHGSANVTVRAVGSEAVVMAISDHLALVVDLTVQR
jgi:endonuclease/exonuclease/phosphatase family metal-dependent hydrolase